jgi:chemotaxis protein CheX
MSEVQPQIVDTFPQAISDAVRDAAAEFFTSSCNLKYQEDPSGNERSSAGFMSTLSFVGATPWSFSLVLPDATAATMAKSFAGFDIPLDSTDMGDVIGEIVNVIAGGIVARLESQGIPARMSLPMVVRGENVSVLIPSGATTRRMSFAGDTGNCWFRLVQARNIGIHNRMPGT